MPTSTSKPYSLVLIGSGGVGKSSITLRFVYDDFQEEYDPTRADSYRKLLPDGKEVDILDTAGQEQYAAIRDNYYRSGEGFMFVFALNDPSSLQAVPPLYAQLRRAIDSPFDPLCLLVGNKSDLKNAIVSKADIEALLKVMPCTYLETSAKANDNVTEAFLKLISMIETQRQAPSSLQVNTKKAKRKRKFKCTIN